MAESKVRLVFQVPGEDEEGFLGRMREGLVFKEALEAGEMSVAALDGLVGFLSRYVREPEAEEERRKLLFRASKKQFTELLNAVIGAEEGEENPTSDGG